MKQRLNAYNSPQESNMIRTRSSTRKRKQHTDSDDYAPPIDTYQPPNKRQKIYHHVDSMCCSK